MIDIAFLLKIKLPFSSAENPSRALTWAYMTAFGLIATLTIASHMVTAYITYKQKESTTISHQISRQRGLVQGIPLHASNYDRLGGKLDRDFLIQSIRDMEESHIYLTNVITKKSKILSEIYFDPPLYLDPQVKKFLEMAKQYLDSPANNEHQRKIRAKALDYIVRQSSGLLLPSLDSALEKYQTDTMREIARYYNLQLWGTFIILMVLLTEAAFIFRPLVSRIDKYHTLLLRQALEDPLTKLPNRRAFMNRAIPEIQQSARQKEPLFVVLADLDHFKLVNDTYGHEVGDKVLQHFARILKKSLRTGDIIGRVGGEEFALILVRPTGPGGGTKVLERLCNKVANTPCKYELSDGSTATLKYTVSMGFVAITPKQETSIEELLRQADEALYKAKEQGRNCVVAAEIL